MAMAEQRADIRVGIGGWTYEPWRETFYPPEVKKAGELAYASRHVDLHRDQRHLLQDADAGNPSAAGRSETPDGFVFAVKANRFATNRKDSRGRRRVGRALPGERPDGAGLQARAVALAARPDEEIRACRDRGLPRGAAERAGRHRLAPRRRGASRDVRVGGVRGARPQAQGSRSVWRCPTITR